VQRERRLREILERVEIAEEHARKAEERARLAEEAAAAAPEPEEVAESVLERRAREAPPEREPEPSGEEREKPQESTASGVINLNSADYEELREFGMSVTQAKRIVTYREKLGGFRSVDDLDQVPGLPKEFRADLKRRSSL
jgi:competence ComEA-like helix-hairpin-helix protein